MATRLVCPSCGSDRLATIEKLEGFADVIVMDDGKVGWGSGGTDILWDTSKTVGIHCRDCDWEADATDDTNLASLLAMPTDDFLNAPTNREEA